MRLGTLIAAGCACASLGAAGCGAQPTPPRPQPPVTLQISAPGDAVTVRGTSVEVSGSVSPAGARVRVQGHAAQVSGGSFRSVVGLQQGHNVIDVAASAPGRATALAAFRVTREERVPVPDLAGLRVDDAARSAQDAGLTLESERGGGLFDPLVPRRLGVCEQSPRAGSEVRRGSTVRIVVARSC